MGQQTGLAYTKSANGVDLIYNGKLVLPFFDMTELLKNLRGSEATSTASLLLNMHNVSKDRAMQLMEALATKIESEQESALQKK